MGLVLAGRPGEYLLEAPDLDINYGVGKRLQLKYETSWNFAGASGDSAVSALGNSLLGIKWRFLDRPTAPLQISVYPQFNFNPVSTREFGLFDRDLELVFPVELETRAGPFNVVSEIGYNLNLTEIDSFKYGVIVGRSVGRVNVGAEIHGESDIELSDNALMITVGAVFTLNHRHSFMASVGKSPRDSTSEDPTLMAYLGIQLRL